MKTELCREETAVAARRTAVAPGFAREELCRNRTAVAVVVPRSRPSPESKPRSRLSCRGRGVSVTRDSGFPSENHIFPTFLIFSSLVYFRILEIYFRLVSLIYQALNFVYLRLVLGLVWYLSFQYSFSFLVYSHGELNTLVLLDGRKPAGMMWLWDFLPLSLFNIVVLILLRFMIIELCWFI